MANVRVKDNGAAFLVCVDGLITSAHNSLGDAWRHIEWMYAVSTQSFTVGENELPVKEGINNMHKAGLSGRHELGSRPGVNDWLDKTE